MVDRAASARTERLAAAGARGRAGRRAAGRAARRRSTTWSSRPGFPPHHPLAGRGVAAGPRRLLRAGAGLAAARAGRAALARGHRHQRQDHHDHDAGRDPARGRAAHRRAGQHRRAAGGRRRRTTAYDVLAVELSSFQLHWSRDAGAAGRRAAQPRRRPPRVARRLRRVRRAPRPPSGARPRRTPARASRSATSTTRGSPRCWRGVPGRRVGFTLGRAGAGAVRASSTACWSTAPAGDADRAGAGRRGPPGRRRTTSPTRCTPRRWPARTACRPTRSAAGLAGLRARAAPQRARGHGRRGGLRRRQQGHQPARRARLADRVPADRLGRRRPAQGRRHRRPGGRASPTGWPARCCSASTGRRSRAALARHAPRRPGRRRVEHR